jgi:plastocyanin
MKENGALSPIARPNVAIGHEWPCRTAMRCYARRMRWTWLAAAMSFLVALPAAAAELRVQVNDQRGRPVADAIVAVLLPPGAKLPPAPPARTHTVNQVSLTFVPYIEVLRPGDSVVFRNGDRTRHHVYSFSAAKAFEFMLSPGESSAPLALERAGVVAVGCNIHDSMITYLYVSEAPWTARTGADGVAVLGGLPVGSYSVQAWQPRLRPGRAASLQEKVGVAEGKPTQLSFQLSLLPDTPPQPHPERARY